MMLPAFARNSALTFFCAVLVFLFPGSPQPLARSSDDKTALQREALLSSQAPRASQAQPLGQTKTEKLANPLNDLLDEAQRDIDEKKFAAAIPPLEKVLADQPDLAYGHFQLAYVYTALKKPKEAKAEYERAARLDPRMSAAYVNLGMLLLENHDETAAVAPLRKAVELLPAESRPRYLLAVALDRSGDRAGAAQAFAALLDLDPNEVHALEYLGWTSLRSGKPAEAEVRFRRALEVQPKGAHGLRGLAESLEAQKKPEAVAAYREYLEINPDDTRAHARLIRLLMDQGQNDAALAEVDRGHRHAASGGGSCPERPAASRRLGTDFFASARFSQRREGTQDCHPARCQEHRLLERSQHHVLSFEKLRSHARGPGSHRSVRSSRRRELVPPRALLR